MSKTQSSSRSRERHRGCLYPAWYPILHLEHAHFEHAHTTGLTPHRVRSIKPSMTSTCTRIAHSESTLPWHPNSLLSCMLLSTLISKLIERSTRLNLIKSITQTYSLHMEYTTMVLCLHCNPIKQTKHCSSNCWMIIADKRTPLVNRLTKPAPIRPMGTSTCTHHSQLPNSPLAPSTPTIGRSTGSSATSVSRTP